MTHMAKVTFRIKLILEHLGQSWLLLVHQPRGAVWGNWEVWIAMGRIGKLRNCLKV